MMEVRLMGSDRSDSRAARRESSFMRGVNRNIGQLSETFSDSGPIAFFCECQSAACHSAIWMSMAAFATTVADRTSWLLLEGHEPSASHRQPRVSRPAAEEYLVPTSLVLPGGST